VVSGLKRIILWDYARASWQYDIMVGLVTVFVLLAPRTWFRDQPRILQASQILALPNGGGYLAPTELVDSIDQQRRGAELSRILTARTGKKQIVSDIEPVVDPEPADSEHAGQEHGVRFYIVHTRP
jgi:hypothetical protein